MHNGAAPAAGSGLWRLPAGAWRRLRHGVHDDARGRRQTAGGRLARRASPHHRQRRRDTEGDEGPTFLLGTLISVGRTDSA